MSTRRFSPPSRLPRWLSFLRRSAASVFAAAALAAGVSACSVPEVPVGGVLEDLPPRPSDTRPSDTRPSDTHAGAHSAPSGAPSPNEPPPGAASDPDPATATAYQELAEIPVKGRAPKTGYAHEQFGQRWSDDVTVEFGHDGCDTRNNILARDLTEVTFKPRTHGCVVLTGVLDDPYSGTQIAFQRGQGTSNAVQIDHLVPLADAWQKGAQSWDASTRQNFANDPRNLLAVDGHLNMQKGAGDAATWLPPNKSFRCEYARRIIDVKHAYGLWVTPAERDALSTQLGTCAG